MLYALGDPLSFVLLLVAFVLAVTLAGWISALTAARVGLAPAGRTRPDPRRQVDPFGAVAGAVAGFGWAQPVEVPSHRRGGAVAFAVLAGPLTLLVVGLAALAAYGAVHSPVPAGSFFLQNGAGAAPPGQEAWVLGGYMATYVGALGLVPLPPLPGGFALFAFAPRSPGWQKAQYQLVERNFGVVAVLLLMLLPLAQGIALLPRVLDSLLEPLMRVISGG